MGNIVIATDRLHYLSYKIDEYSGVLTKGDINLIQDIILSRIDEIKSKENKLKTVWSNVTLLTNEQIEELIDLS
jgi:hypothetical protein